MGTSGDKNPNKIAFQAPRNPRGIVCTLRGAFFRASNISPCTVRVILNSSVPFVPPVEQPQAGAQFGSRRRFHHLSKEQLEAVAPTSLCTHPLPNCS